MNKKLKVLLAFDSPYATARGYDFSKEFEDPDWNTEKDVHRALCENGHEVRLLGLYNDISVLLEEIKECKPDIVFNLAEVFKDKTYFDKNIVALLEMLEVPYTGATLAGLLLCGDKALTKKILTFHRIKVPNFQVFYRARHIRLLHRLKLPVVVKPLQEEASRGISQASVADSEAALIERVKFIQESMGMDVIAEEYIEGRELYVSIIGNSRIRILPFREIKFGQFPQDEPRIATYKAKWDDEYRKKWEIKNAFAGRLSEGLDVKIEALCKRAYRALNLQDYARFDIRVTAQGNVYILEVNANPCLANDDEIAQSAQKAGISYNALIQKIVDLALVSKPQ
ncbi:MAG: ATP-grasp domain-containing protein [Candidatus Omnitrophica bacterium]|nr:ATP-grasp domain-containing protein [Candidatus Omnitrophota bacterium]